MYLGLALLAVPVIAAICFLAYLSFCVFVVLKTNNTECLRDVAVAMRAYKVPLLSRTSQSQINEK